MYSPLGTRNMWPELLHLARLVPRGGPALPFIFVPAFRNAAFKVLFYSRQHLLHLFENKTDSILLVHIAYSSRQWPIHIILQNSARAWLAESDFSDAADGKV